MACKGNIGPPVWSQRVGRPRVLVEGSDEAWRRATMAELEKYGYDVLGCAGPDLDHDEHCPAVEGERCPGSAHADVVVCDLDLTDGHAAQVPRAVARELRDGASVIVVLDEPEEADGDLDGCRLVERPASPVEVVVEVERAVDDLRNTPAPMPIHSRRQLWGR
jgi:hypothetical protein